MGRLPPLIASKGTPGFMTGLRAARKALASDRSKRKRVSGMVDAARQRMIQVNTKRLNSLVRRRASYRAKRAMKV